MTLPELPAAPLPVPRYRGRFAPSPTGPLHFGSLVAALGSCLAARTRGGEWWVRMEDVDRDRTLPGAADDILRTLAAFGFEWDGPVVVQTQRLEAYQAALEALKQQGHAYPCGCSRKEIAAAGLPPAVDGGIVYPGTCRAGLPAGRTARAWRLRTSEVPISVDDALQGRITQCLPRDVGDFVLLRADGMFAYQLAVVVDDAWQGMTDVVRGADLLDSTPRQVWLQRCLGVPTPRYAHLPVAVTANGEKLSKQTRAPALDLAQTVPLLCRALRFLGQAVPDDLADASLAACWAWARANWDETRIPRQRAVVEAL